MDIDGPVPGVPGAAIRGVASLPAVLADASPAGQFAWAKPGQLLLEVPSVARFLVRDGATIDVAVSPDADPGMVRLLLNGSARGALIYQRGDLPLHAATLVPPGGAEGVAICGTAGAGKSTLAAELSRRGWVLVADDTSRVSWNTDHPIAWPSRDSIKLWRDACDAGGLDVAGLERVTRDLDKYYVPVPARSEPVRLATVVELITSGPQQGAALSAGARMSLLTRHAYRQSYIRPLGRQAEFVRLVGRMAGVCRTVQLSGARVRTVGELADDIERMVG
jgi:hypothetical protein